MAARNQTASELPGDLGARLAAGDPAAIAELVAARAAAVHAYAVGVGMQEGRTAFVVAVLRSAHGAADADGRLLAVVGAMSSAAAVKVGRRRRRRGEREFRAARAAAVPVAVAAAALRLLGERQDPCAAAREPDCAASSTGWVPAALATPEGGTPGRRAGPADWLAPALHAANGSALPAPPVLRVAPPERGTS